MGCLQRMLRETDKRTAGQMTRSTASMAFVGRFLFGGDKMSNLERFSESIEIPNIPEGPGVCIIQDELGRILQVAMSGNIRRRVGDLFDGSGTTASHGPAIFAAQQQGHRVFVRWKITANYKAEKKSLMQELHPLWDQTSPSPDEG